MAVVLGNAALPLGVVSAGEIRDFVPTRAVGS